MVIALIDDRRAWVPFALVGVLIVVASAAYASGIAQQGLVGEDRSVERAMDRVDADATAALKTAARRAARDAAAEPVTRPSTASSTHAAVRNGSAFEDALRVRLALAGVDALAAVRADVGEVSASASLPPVDDPSELSSGRDRVAVAPVANGTAMRVTFANVTTRATRDGRVVAERSRHRTVVVAVPTFAAHERTERFERRLNRGPVAGPGLGRQLTASLYPMTWARGYAQYGGAPVRNVLANRHVELATNAGIARIQRDVFGSADPDTRAGVARATARTGVADLLAPTGVDETSWSEAVIDAPLPRTEAESPLEPGEPDGSDRDAETTVTVGHAADEAAVAVHDELDDLVRSAYRVDARRVVSVTTVEESAAPDPEPPADGRRSVGESDTEATPWEPVERSTDEQVTVDGGAGVPRRTASSAVPPEGTLAFESVTRSIAVTRIVTVTWERTTADGRVERESTRRTTTDRYRVRIAIEGTYAPERRVPNHPTATFGAGTALDGPDLTGVPNETRTALGVGDAAAVDDVARDAVRAPGESSSTVVYGDRPEELTDWVAADLTALHAAVRAVETDVRMAAVATGEADPYGDLAETLRDRRAELVDAPEVYDGAADRARVAARAAYVDAVIEELEAASADDAAATDGLAAAIGDEQREAGDDAGDGVADGASIGDVVASRHQASDAEPYAVGEDGPGGAVRFRPAAAPGYLPRTPVDGAHVEGVDGTTRPLATRNLNYVTAPYGDVASGIVDRILGTEEAVRLGVAGRALLAADDALGERDDADLRADTHRLADRVERSLSAVDRDVERVVRTRTSLSGAEARRAVDAAAERTDSPGERAVSVGNGSYAVDVAARAATIGDLSAAEEAALAARLRVTLRTAERRDAVAVPSRLVEDATEDTRRLTREAIETNVEGGTASAGEAAADRWAPAPVRSVGAGLPVAPVPGYWVATVNAWRVEVRGEYPRFELRADVGPPGESFGYVRESGTVTVDVAGESVVLGETEPVRFETGTVVVVAVPAGPPGVGDVDGVRDETSPGWPCPGDIGAEAGDCRDTGVDR